MNDSSRPIASSSCLLLATLALGACGGEDLDRAESPGEERVHIEDQPEDSEAGGEKADSPDGPEEEQLPDEDALEPSEPGSQGPLIESFRYQRWYEDCTETLCMFDIEFGLRSGVMTRYQYGSIADRRVLSDTDYERMRELILRDDFVAAMREGAQMSCPEPTSYDSYNVHLSLSVYEQRGEVVWYEQDASGCYASRSRELPDEVIDFAERMNTRYEVE